MYPRLLRRCASAMFLFAFSFVAGCQTPMNESSATQFNLQPPEWPLRFESHNFDARCFNTLECSVIYDNFEHIWKGNEPSLSSETLGPDYLKGWNGSYGVGRSFPKPAQVNWVSKDGTRLHAEIDIGEIFKDKRVYHNVPREEVSLLTDGKYRSIPSILLEVNDRTVRVYMRALIPLNHEKKPGSVGSPGLYELVLVKTYNY